MAVLLRRLEQLRGHSGSRYLRWVAANVPLPAGDSPGDIVALEGCVDVGSVIGDSPEYR